MIFSEPSAFLIRLSFLNRQTDIRIVSIFAETWESSRFYLKILLSDRVSIRARPWSD